MSDQTVGAPAPSHLLIHFKTLGGGMAYTYPARLRLSLRDDESRGKQRFWFGRGEHDGWCLIATDDQRWVMFWLDNSDLYRSFEEVPPEPDGENREVTEREAVDWLGANRHELPDVLVNRVIADEPRTVAISMAADETRQDSNAPGNPIGAQSVGRAIPRGDLDERATIQLKKNPSLSSTQIAAIVGCSRTTLSNYKRCPLFVAARRAIKAEKITWKRGNERGDEWTDRCPDED